MKIKHPRDMTKADAKLYRKQLRETRIKIKRSHDHQKTIENARFNAMMRAADLERAINGFDAMPKGSKGRAPAAAPQAAARGPKGRSPRSAPKGRAPAGAPKGRAPAGAPKGRAPVAARAPT